VMTIFSRGRNGCWSLKLAEIRVNTKRIVMTRTMGI
jgi:hypothetical protein